MIPHSCIGSFRPPAVECLRPLAAHPHLIRFTLTWQWRSRRRRPYNPIWLGWEQEGAEPSWRLLTLLQTLICSSLLYLSRLWKDRPRVDIPLYLTRPRLFYYLSFATTVKGTPQRWVRRRSCAWSFAYRHAQQIYERVRAALPNLINSGVIAAPPQQI